MRQAEILVKSPKFWPHSDANSQSDIGFTIFQLRLWPERIINSGMKYWAHNILCCLLAVSHHKYVQRMFWAHLQVFVLAHIILKAARLLTSVVVDCSSGREMRRISGSMFKQTPQSKPQLRFQNISFSKTQTC